MKMFYSLLIIVLFVSFLYLYFIKTYTADYFKGPLSDHFDGKIFFNPKPYNHYTKKSTTDLFRWWFSRDKQKWPTQVANLPHDSVLPVDKPNIVKVTFINHSTVLLQTIKLNILTDPIWSDRASPFSFMGPRRVRDPGIPFSELPRIDAVLISHNHYDHLDLNTLQKLDKKFHPVFLIPLGNKIFLNKFGITNVVELDWWQQYKLGTALITFLPTQHWSARWLNDKYRTLWGSFGIEIENKKIYFAGDTGYSDNFIKIRKHWHVPDLAFLPIGSYKPEWFMRGNHMDPEEAVKAHLDLQSHQSIGIHFGTFQLSDEAIDQPVKDLEVALKDYHVTGKEFFLIKEGKNLSF